MLCDSIDRKISCPEENSIISHSRFSEGFFIVRNPDRCASTVMAEQAISLPRKTWQHNEISIPSQPVTENKIWMTKSPNMKAG